MVADAGLQPPLATHGRGRPRLRLIAVLIADLGTLAATGMLGVGVQLAWLLVPTERGRLDVPPWAADTGVALLGGLLLAWSALQLRSLAARGATLGTRLVGGRPTSLPRGRAARALWLALHPAASVAWLWGAATLALPGWAPAGLPLLAVAMLVLALGGGSLALLLVRPEAAPLHTRAARLLAARGC